MADHLNIIKDIIAGNLSPIYLLHGEESFYIDEIVKAAEVHILDEGQKSFNYTQVYGKDADPESLGNALRRFPMMAPYQLIVLKEAKEMKGLMKLEDYVASPNPTTIFVIAYKHKKVDGRSAFLKSCKKNGIVFESKALRDYQVGKWIGDYIKSKGFKANQQIQELIAESLGTNLSKVSNELDKLFINLPAGSEVTQDIVEKQIGISKDYNVFELTKALGLRDVLKSNKIINYFIANPKDHPMVLINGAVFNFFSKLYMTHFLRGQGDAALASALRVSPFFVKEYRAAAQKYPLAKTEQIIDLISQYDLKSKGYENPFTSQGDLLREMVWKILH